MGYGNCFRSYVPYYFFLIFQGQGILPPLRKKKEQGDEDREFSWIFQNRICNQKDPTKTCKESNEQKHMLRLLTAREKSVVSRDKNPENTPRMRHSGW